MLCDTPVLALGVAIVQMVKYVTHMTNAMDGADNTPDQEIGSRITNALIIKSTNVKALSEETGISYPTLRRSLTGGRSLTIRELASIASALNIQPSALLPDALAGRKAA